MSKKIAIYGTFERQAPTFQRYWKRRADVIKQRYWKKTKRMKIVEESGRYEFSGTGKDLYKATAKAHKIVPKGFIDISAKEFLKQPEKYGYEGEWIEKDIKS